MEIVPFCQLRISQHSFGPEAEELKLKISQPFHFRQGRAHPEMGIGYHVDLPRSGDSGAGVGDGGQMGGGSTNPRSHLPP